MLFIPNSDMFFLFWNSQSFHLHVGGSHVLLHKPWHEQVHSARSSCTVPEQVRKRSEFGWK